MRMMLLVFVAGCLADTGVCTYVDDGGDHDGVEVCSDELPGQACDDVGGDFLAGEVAAEACDGLGFPARCERGQVVCDGDDCGRASLWVADAADCPAN